MTHSVKLRSKN